jgi:hypothetical protein
MIDVTLWLSMAQIEDRPPLPNWRNVPIAVKLAHLPQVDEQLRLEGRAIVGVVYNIRHDVEPAFSSPPTFQHTVHIALQVTRVHPDLQNAATSEEIRSCLANRSD